MVLGLSSVGKPCLMSKPLLNTTLHALAHHRPSAEVRILNPYPVGAALHSEAFTWAYYPPTLLDLTPDRLLTESVLYHRSWTMRTKASADFPFKALMKTGRSRSRS